MPNVRAVPTVRRRRLGEALRRYRNEAHERREEDQRMSIEYAAEEMGWNESKLSRIETAKARIS
ncbi:helix-turn-helix domain-containing protein, partial [Streptomyces sp. GSL17-113]|uniref:helix-turn-helix domain-containing protein n=1 Tax=Streptomyces sp. GSL17-113 TaxID=3115365 RepID=UPI002E7A9D58